MKYFLACAFLLLAARGVRAEQVCATYQDGGQLYCEDNFKCNWKVGRMNCISTFFSPAKGLEEHPCLRRKSAPAEPARPAVNAVPEAPASVLISEGNGRYREGDYSGALLFWNKAIARAPELEERLRPYLLAAYQKRGNLFYQNGQYDNAIHDFDEALAIKPGLPAVLQARAAAYQARTGRKAAAPPPEETAPDSAEPLARAFSAAAKIGGLGAIAPEPAAAVKTFRWLVRPVIKTLSLLLLILFVSLLPWGRSTGTCVAWTAVYLIASMTPPVLIAVGVGCAAWVYYDFGKITAGVPRERLEGISRFASTGFGWAAWTLCFWFAGFPKYLSVRLDYMKIAVPPPAPPLQAAPPPPPAPAPGPAITAGRGSLYDQARARVAEGKYEAARELLARKTLLDLRDYDLFLEIYVRNGDFMRAKLTASQIGDELLHKPGAGGGYSFYFGLAAVCGDKGEAGLANQLRRIALDGLAGKLFVADSPKEFYVAAVDMEKAGETDLALRVYAMFEKAGVDYLDVARRRADLKEKIAAPKMQAAPPPPPGGAQVTGRLLGGRYELKGELGQGAMGVVYEGWDRQTGRSVAVKRMHPWLKEYPEEYERFRGEADIVGHLKHPNIVATYGLTEDRGDVYLIFDHVDGTTLASLLREKKRFPLDECKNIFKGVCEAVHYAHALNVIHRDLKPANIMLDTKGRIFVMDFGLASRLRESLTRVTHQTMSGTPAYMAPEQHDGVVKRESDVFALGVCLYEMLTGELPFRDPDLQKKKLTQDYRQVGDRLPWLPAGVDKVIDRALAPEASQRFADPLDFYRELSAL